ncbi:MAG: transposase, partial [Cyanobacteria bacterium QH_10_48_56]
GSGMLKNRKLSKAISDLGWYQFRTLLETKATKYEREIQVISRWEPSSQTCSNCGERGGKKHLGIRAWECLSCGSWLDRDINAAKNIKAVGGQSKALNGRGGKRKTNPLAAANEASTSIQLESPRL